MSNITLEYLDKYEASFVSTDTEKELLRLARVGLTHEKLEELYGKPEIRIELEQFTRKKTQFNGWANMKHLINIGLWAQEWAIPSLKRYEQEIGVSFIYAKEALSALVEKDGE